MSEMLLDPEARGALAEDLDTLAYLQAGELSGKAIEALRALEFPANLGLVPRGADAVAAFDSMSRAIAALGSDGRESEALAADFAAIYLNGQLGASPCESVWLDDDHLAYQAPMFELRKIYRQRGFAAPDWRRRPDDHLVLQLQFLARLTSQVDSRDGLREIAVFLDEHLLRWIQRFALRVAQRCDTDFYRALVVLTAAYVDQLRALIAEDLGEPRPSAEEVEARCARARPSEVAPVRFLPGSGPSW